MVICDLIKEKQFKKLIIKNNDGDLIKEKQFKKLIIKNSDGDLIKDNQFKKIINNKYHNVQRFIIKNSD